MRHLWRAVPESQWLYRPADQAETVRSIRWSEKDTPHKARLAQPEDPTISDAVTRIEKGLDGSYTLPRAPEQQEPRAMAADAGDN